ncbi:hypothetical protein IRZ79_15485 [Pseudomonas putida]|nr:hypothetical protein [Pseudomonas putida]
MRVDVNLTALNLQDRDRHFIHAEAHGERPQLLHLPAIAFVHPGRCDGLDFPYNKALILSQQQLNEPGLIVEHFRVVPELTILETLNANVVPVGAESSGNAMPVHESIAKHARNAGHVSLLRTEHILISETVESSRAGP